MKHQFFIIDNLNNKFHCNLYGFLNFLIIWFFFLIVICLFLLIPKVFLLVSIIFSFRFLRKKITREFLNKIIGYESSGIYIDYDFIYFFKSIKEILFSDLKTLYSKRTLFVRFYKIIISFVKLFRENLVNKKWVNKI